MQVNKRTGKVASKPFETILSEVVNKTHVLVCFPLLGTETCLDLTRPITYPLFLNNNYVIVKPVTVDMNKEPAVPKLVAYYKNDPSAVSYTFSEKKFLKSINGIRSAVDKILAVRNENAKILAAEEFAEDSSEELRK